MPGSVKTEAVVLRSLRYGEADRILHLYTPQRGRVGAIAKGVRRAQEPLRRAPRAVLSPAPGAPRGPQRAADGDERRDRHRPRAAARGRPRARQRRARVRRRRAPVRDHRAASWRLRAAVQRARAARRATPSQATHANQLAFRLKLLLAAGLAPQLAACAGVRRGRAPRRPSRAPPAASSAARCEATGFPLGEEAHTFMTGALGSPLAEAPARRRARAAPGRAGDRRDRRAPRARRWRLRPRSLPAAIGSRAMGDAAAGTKWVYDFTEGSREMRDLLGGKGANVAEMTRILGAERVPAGFTITTEACVAYMERPIASPTGWTARSTRRSPGWRSSAGKTARRPRGPAARLRALAARASRCPACSTPS